MGGGGSKQADVNAAVKALGKDEVEKIQAFYHGLEDSKTMKIDHGRFQVCHGSSNRVLRILSLLMIHGTVLNEVKRVVVNVLRNFKNRHRF